MLGCSRLEGRGAASRSACQWCFYDLINAGAVYCGRWVKGVEWWICDRALK